jgi:S1-C subfamily serine protease
MIVNKSSLGIAIFAVFVFVEVFTRIVGFSFIPTRFLSNSLQTMVGGLAGITAQIHPLHLSGNDFDAGALKRTSSGSGFFVRNDGVIVSNYHVVKGCTKIEVISRGKNIAASLMSTSETYDLVALKVTVANPSSSTRFVLAPPKTATSALVFGYPLEGIVSDTGNYGEGTVSAEGGLRYHPELFQITTPIQKGHSGSAVIDSDGNLLGVATAKLNVMSVARLTGDIAQNVNFAISSRYVGDFLSLSGVNLRSDFELNYLTENLRKLFAPAPQDFLMNSAVKIVCYKIHPPKN